jgi:hypothetical protein
MRRLALAALLAFQLLPVRAGNPLFVAAWVMGQMLLASLFGWSYSRARRLRAVDSQPT